MQNIEIGMVWGLRVTHGHQQCHHLIGPYDFLSTVIETMCLSCTIFEL